MDPKRWQKHLAAIISLQSRAQNIIQSLNFARLLTKSLSPSMAAEKLLRAEEAQHLLRQAERVVLLLKEGISEGEAEALHSIINSVHSDLNRINAIVNILKRCNAHWGLNDLEESSRHPSSEAESGERTMEPMSAVARIVSAIDNFQTMIKIKG